MIDLTHPFVLGSLVLLIVTLGVLRLLRGEAGRRK